jgi:hypothetical protein
MREAERLTGTNYKRISDVCNNKYGRKAQVDILGASLKMKGVDYMSFYYSNEIVFRGHP